MSSKKSDKESASPVIQLHKMPWLRHVPSSITRIPDGKNWISLPKKEGEKDYFPGVKTEKKKYSKKSKSEFGLTCNCDVNTQKPLEVVIAATENIWNKDIDVPNKLFPGAESLQFDIAQEQEIFDMAIEASIITAQLEVQKEPYVLQTEGLKIIDDGSDDEWGAVKRNLSDIPQGKENKQPQIDGNFKFKENEIFVDKYGRINGDSERHLFMGKGARLKEQQFLKNLQPAIKTTNKNIISKALEDDDPFKFTKEKDQNLQSKETYRKSYGSKSFVNSESRKKVTFNISHSSLKSSSNRRCYHNCQLNKNNNETNRNLVEESFEEEQNLTKTETSVLNFDKSRRDEHIRSNRADAFEAEEKTEISIERSEIDNSNHDHRMKIDKTNWEEEKNELKMEENAVKAKVSPTNSEKFGKNHRDHKLSLKKQNLFEKSKTDKLEKESEPIEQKHITEHDTQHTDKKQQIKKLENQNNKSKESCLNDKIQHDLNPSIPKMKSENSHLKNVEPLSAYDIVPPTFQNCFNQNEQFKTTVNSADNTQSLPMLPQIPISCYNMGYYNIPLQQQSAPQLCSPDNAIMASVPNLNLAYLPTVMNSNNLHWMQSGQNIFSYYPAQSLMPNFPNIFTSNLQNPSISTLNQQLPTHMMYNRMQQIPLPNDQYPQRPVQSITSPVIAFPANKMCSAHSTQFPYEFKSFQDTEKSVSNFMSLYENIPRNVNMSHVTNRCPPGFERQNSTFMGNDVCNLTRLHSTCDYAPVKDFKLNIVSSNSSECDSNESTQIGCTNFPIITPRQILEAEKNSQLFQTKPTQTNNIKAPDSICSNFPKSKTMENLNELRPLRKIGAGRGRIMQRTLP